jgi:hypothetical protein
MPTLKTMQEEQRTWVNHNFPGRGDYYPLLGVVEELGELVTSEISEDNPGIFDAIADITIFMADYCTAQGYDIDEIYTDAPEQVARRDAGEYVMLIVAEVGRIAHHHLKRLQNIRGTHDEHGEMIKYSIGMILTYLDFYCFEQGKDFMKIVEDTWSEVKKRDWKVNPITGDNK